MKSHVTVFSTLYDALKKDVEQWYDSIDLGLDRDLSRLQSAVSQEGLPFLTITQPEMCNFFQKSLSDGTLVTGDSPRSRPRGFRAKSRTDLRPQYLHGLMSLVFHQDGTLMADPDVTAIFFIRQWLLMAKKVEVPCSEERVEATLAGYLEIDSRLPDHHPSTWDQDDPVWTRRVGHPLWGRPQPVAQSDFGFPVSDYADDVDWELYRAVCDRIRSLIGTFDP